MGGEGGVRPALCIKLDSSYIEDAGEVDSKNNVTNYNDGYNNPRRSDDGVVIWDCIYFGSYPQSKSSE